jgi:hypothetical protein
MKFKEIQHINKELQKIAKKEPTWNNKAIIRHWNVFYNQYRNRDISIIEQKSNTPLYEKTVQNISLIFGLELPLIKTSYSVEEELYFLEEYSSVYLTLIKLTKKEEVSNEE